MKTCTFFGHSDAPRDILDRLYLTLEDLIVNKNVCCFLVGNQGAFDRTVLRTLRLLKIDYPHIEYSIVIPYLDTKKDEIDENDKTVFPGILDSCRKLFVRNLCLYKNQGIRIKRIPFLSYSFTERLAAMVSDFSFKES